MKPDMENMPVQAAVAWHALGVTDALTQLGVTEKGLDTTAATERLRQFGPNRLPPAAKRSALARFAAQFNNLIIYVLLVAGLVTAILGHWVDTGVIVGVVVINALIGFIQEGKAEQALEAVRNMLSAQAVVLRNGQRTTLAADQLVPGDVVFLQSGDRVPADLRMLRAKELRIDEAMLTGESVPVQKHTEPVAEQLVLGDRRNLAFSGTLVTTGQGVGLVVTTGADTEIGHISKLLAQVQMLTTPLLRQLDHFGRWLTGAILVIAGATFLFGVWMRDYNAGEMFLAVVGLAVAAIPEGLPAIITITLAVGVQTMARRNAIIRRLPAVEALGSVSVICSDKTGTLTRNEMTTRSVACADSLYAVSGVGYDTHGGFSAGEGDLAVATQPGLMELCRAGLLCNDAAGYLSKEGWRFEGDPTEIALLVMAIKAGLDPTQCAEEFPRDDVIPFESEHRFMATLHHDHAGHGFIYLKGAAEAVLTRCSHEWSQGETRPLNPEVWHARLDEIGGLGQRTLALAFRPEQGSQRSISFSDVDGGLTLLGVVGIIDPPRDEAIAAVARCRSAGIRVKMITGDHAATASAIAQQMGISEGRRAITGEQLAQLDEAGLQQAALENDVFARVSPEHKLLLVEALQAKGEVVVMTGDGVNDAPALKRADVGVAMGIKGTEAAKEAAEMVLVDDNFASITAAVEEGRRVYDNIKKSILFILPTNGGEAMTLIAAIMMGRMLPVTAAQILWVNMITAVTLALSLAFEPAESAVMRRPPRAADEPILSRFMVWRILFVSLIMVCGVFGLFLWERNQGTDIETARTVAVNMLVVFEVFYLFSCRYLKAPVLNPQGLLGNPKVLWSVGLVMVMQLIFTYTPPMQLFFHSAPLSLEAWLRILLVGSSVLFLVELEKWLIKRLSVVAEADAPVDS